MSIRTAIVDDEKSCCEALEWQLKEYLDDIEIVGVYNTLEEAVHGLPDVKPDLTFLDIRLRGRNAFELLSMLEPVHFGVIFTTAFDEYAVRAFKENAIDYLLKPVDHKDLESAVHRFRNRSAEVNGNLESIVKRFNDSSTKRKAKKIALSTSENFLFVSVENIVSCESEGNYTNIYFKDGSKVLMSKTLKILEDILDPDEFMRINQSCIINLSYVTKFERFAGGFVILSTGKSIPISKSRRADFFKKFPRV